VSTGKEAKKEEDYPVMMRSEFTAGQEMMAQFLKGVDITVRGNKVNCIYRWEFPDELVAKSFAEAMKSQFDVGEEE